MLNQRPDQIREIVRGRFQAEDLQLLDRIITAIIASDQVDLMTHMHQIRNRPELIEADVGTIFEGQPPPQGCFNDIGPRVHRGATLLVFAADMGREMAIRVLLSYGASKAVPPIPANPYYATGQYSAAQRCRAPSRIEHQDHQALATIIDGYIGDLTGSERYARNLAAESLTQARQEIERLRNNINVLLAANFGVQAAPNNPDAAHVPAVPVHP